MFFTGNGISMDGNNVKKPFAISKQNFQKQDTLLQNLGHFERQLAKLC